MTAAKSSESASDHVRENNVKVHLINGKLGLLKAYMTSF